MNDALTKDILKAVGPPMERRSAKLDAVYSVIIGAAAALLQCKQLLEVSAAPSKKRYRPGKLYDDLVKASGDLPGDAFQWDHNSDWRDWSAGFFLNRAQHNIAAAFDRCLTTWVAVVLKLPVGDNHTEDMWMQGFPPSRLAILRRLVRKRRRFVGDLQHAYSPERNFGDSATARKLVDVMTGKYARAAKCSSAPLARTSRFVQVNEAGCLAIVCGFTNDFKHRIEGLRRKKHFHRMRIEFVITVRALSFLGTMLMSLEEEASG